MEFLYSRNLPSINNVCVYHLFYVFLCHIELLTCEEFVCFLFFLFDRGKYHLLVFVYLQCCELFLNFCFPVLLTVYHSFFTHAGHLTRNTYSRMWSSLKIFYIMYNIFKNQKWFLILFHFVIIS